MLFSVDYKEVVRGVSYIIYPASEEKQQQLGEGRKKKEKKPVKMTPSVTFMTPTKVASPDTVPSEV